MRIYISGPISGMPEMNFPAFNKADCFLKSKGFTTLNPAAYPSGLEYHHYMDISMAYVRSSEALLMLDGWENSKGAKAEHAYATSIGMKIFYSFDELENVPRMRM